MYDHFMSFWCDVHTKPCHKLCDILFLKCHSFSTSFLTCDDLSHTAFGSPNVISQTNLDFQRFDFCGCHAFWTFEGLACNENDRYLLYAVEVCFRVNMQQDEYNTYKNWCSVCDLSASCCIQVSHRMIDHCVRAKLPLFFIYLLVA